MDFPPLFKNCPFLIWTGTLSWGGPRGFGSAHPAPGGKSTVNWGKLVRMRGKTPSPVPSTYQLQPCSPQWGLGGWGGGSRWGHNCSLLLTARGGDCAATSWIRASSCLSLNKRMWWWKWWCVTSKPPYQHNRPCKLLLSSPGPGTIPLNRMKVSGDRGLALPALPADYKGDPRREAVGPCPPQVSHRILRHTHSGNEARKLVNICRQQWLSNWFIPHFRKVANSEGTQLY